MQLRIRIQDAVGGKTQTAEVPSDVPLEKLLQVLPSKLGLPVVHADGRPIDYHLYYKDLPLPSGATLDSAGVVEDTTLSLAREAIAGCFPAGTRITLADRTDSPIEEIKPGDLILSYDPQQGSTETGTVKRILTDSAEEYLIINDVLRVTESHLIYVGEEWRQAGRVSPGDVLTALSGQRIAVDSVRHEALKGKVFNLHLSSQSHTFFAEGILVHNADRKLDYASAAGTTTATGAPDFEVTFDPDFSPDEVKGILTALADYYRAAGGAGFELDLELEGAPVGDPVNA
jgi:hypothetical protein